MIEQIKLVGSIVGLLVGVFTAWDRLIRGRPLASLTMTGSPSNPYSFIRIKNISPIDILIIDVVAYPRRFKIAKNDSTFGIGKSLVGNALVHLISPNERNDFPFFAQPSISEDEPSQRIYVFVFWRKSNSTWIPQVPKIIFTSTTDLNRMAKGL